jgi:hypothetical protein
MSFDLLDTVKEYFGSELITRASAYLGESETTLRRSLGALIPVSLAGILQSAESAPEPVLNLAKQAAGGRILNNFPASFQPGGPGVPVIGTSSITSIFGSRFGSIARTISNFTGLKESSTTSLFGIIVPLALAILGKHAADNNLSTGAFSSFLTTQKDSVLSTVPADLNVSKMFAPREIHKMFAEPVKRAKRPTWPFPVISVIIALFLAWSLIKTCTRWEKAAVIPESDSGTIKKKM